MSAAAKNACLAFAQCSHVVVDRDHLSKVKSVLLFSQVPLTDMCLCLQAAASASASANTDVVAKKADIAVPVIIAKKQGDCHWC